MRKKRKYVKRNSGRAELPLHIEQKAFMLYYQVRNLSEVARQIEHPPGHHPATNTVRNWKRKYGWEKRCEELDKRAKERTDEETRKAIARGIKGARYIQQQYLQQEDVPIKPKEFLEAQNQELRLMGILTPEEKATEDQVKGITVVFDEDMTPEGGDDEQS